MRKSGLALRVKLSNRRPRNEAHAVTQCEGPHTEGAPRDAAAHAPSAHSRFFYLACHPLPPVTLDSASLGDRDPLPTASLWQLHRPAQPAGEGHCF